MTFALSPPAVRAGYRLAAYDTIDSTSAEALRRAVAGERGPLWVVSSEQTAGRGRRGNQWRWFRGNLAASLLLTTPLDPAVLSQLGFVSGLAVVRALESLGGSRGAAFRLKWPNDVLADGGKLVGILLQTELLPGGERAVVIGIGINVVAAPEGLAYPAASLGGLGYALDAAQVFDALSESWVECERLWDCGRGFYGIRHEWLRRATGVGGPVSVRAGEALWTGMFETIDEIGQLVMRREDGSVRRISAGEVHFGSAHSDRSAAPVRGAEA